MQLIYFPVWVTFSKIATKMMNKHTVSKNYLETRWDVKRMEFPKVWRRSEHGQRRPAAPTALRTDTAVTRGLRGHRGRARRDAAGSSPAWKSDTARCILDKLWAIPDWDKPPLRSKQRGQEGGTQVSTAAPSGSPALGAHRHRGSGFRRLALWGAQRNHLGMRGIPLPPLPRNWKHLRPSGTQLCRARSRGGWGGSEGAGSGDQGPAGRHRAPGRGRGPPHPTWGPWGTRLRIQNWRPAQSEP